MTKNRLNPGLRRFLLRKFLLCVDLTIGSHKCLETFLALFAGSVFHADYSGETFFTKKLGYCNVV